MKLSEYISIIGDSAAAVLFGVPERRITSWRLGHRSPRTDFAPEIIEKTKGKVTWAGIYPKKEKVNS